MFEDETPTGVVTAMTVALFFAVLTWIMLYIHNTPVDIDDTVFLSITVPFVLLWLTQNKFSWTVLVIYSIQQHWSMYFPQGMSLPSFY